MGISERKEREREQMRQAILAAALKLFTEQGFDAVSIRRIADLIEYSPTTIYLYFKDKNEIFYHLRAQGFTKLLEYHNRYTAREADPHDRFNAYGKAYIDFGLENPEYYRLMFVMAAPMQTEVAQQAGDQDPGHIAFSTLHKYVEGAMQAGLLPPGDSEAVAYLYHSVVHGLVSLAMQGKWLCEEDFEADRERVYKAYDYFMKA